MTWEMHNEEDILSAILRGCEECLEAGGWHKTCLTWGKLKDREKIYSEFPAYAGFLCYDVSCQLACSETQ